MGMGDNKSRQPNRFSIPILACFSFNSVFALGGLAILALDVLILKDVEILLLFLQLVSLLLSIIIVQIISSLLAIANILLQYLDARLPIESCVSLNGCMALAD